MSLASRLSDLATAIGADIKNLRTTKANLLGAGPLGARGAANAVPAGTEYFATDYFGGARFRSDGAQWRLLNVLPKMIDLRAGVTSYDLTGLNPDVEEGYDFIVSGYNGDVDQLQVGRVMFLDNAGAVLNGWYENTMAYWGQDINNTNIGQQFVETGNGLGFRFADNPFNKASSYISRGNLKTLPGSTRSYVGDFGGSPRANSNERIRYIYAGNYEETAAKVYGLRWAMTVGKFYGMIEVRPRLLTYTF